MDEVILLRSLCRSKPAGDFKFAAHHCGIVSINRQINIFKHDEGVIKFAGGKVLNTTFAQYPILTSSEAPTVDVVFVEDKTKPMQGLGEPAVASTTAAVANAVYDAVGIRLWDLPFTPDKVLAALAAKS